VRLTCGWPCFVAAVFGLEELLFPSAVGDPDGSLERDTRSFDNGVQGLD
jgi:hypothetical protein